MSTTQKQTCVSCGATLKGAFCCSCGERVLTHADRSVWVFWRRALAQLTDVRSALLVSLRLLVQRPGMLTTEYLIGRRRPYASPIKLFLIANLIYFVVQPWSGYSGYNTTLEHHLDRQIYSSLLPLRGWIEQRMNVQGLAADQFTLLFEAQSEILAKTLVILLVPMLSTALALMLIRKRRRFLDHLVFSVHYYVFELLFVLSVFLPLWGLIISKLLSLQQPESWSSTALSLAAEFGPLVVSAVYLCLALRRCYALSTLGAAGFAVVLIPMMILNMQLYRLLLFGLAAMTLN